MRVLAVQRMAKAIAMLQTLRGGLAQGYGWLWELSPFENWPGDYPEIPPGTWFAVPLRPLRAGVWHPLPVWTCLVHSLLTRVRFFQLRVNP